ncbi:Magnesium-transporting ATPase, P-type 1 [Nonomuraea coxensis DSM 45129]|uniref:Magnesium-transporting ATPase, P-type 1 n=1 Tax=Nonomuraea coxensis DSM 45129 TaxID=1122611 RepID=A0ABX8TU40_9ACTN|nr:magnesium-translocating P-type ATPase [Nonomuraea coxensis]QYC38995.1 Magnesium-transporting ATPase, P-type 1 [Nonomuraea coxensis DSM 45129]
MVWAPEAADTPLRVLRRLETGPRGLVAADAEARLLDHGENVVPSRRPPTLPRRFVRSLRDPFTLVLLGLGLVSALIASWATAGVIVLLVAVSCLLRSNGEYRADRSTAALRRLVATTTTVRRRATKDAEPEEREIPADQLVPGDVIKLGPGDLVPADARLLRANGLTVHQAQLTGESAPVPKRALDLPEGDEHLLWQGSSVTSGSALAVVTATGAATRFAGAYAGPLPSRRGAGRRTSAFDRSVNGLSWVLVRGMLVIPPVALVANAVLRGKGLEALPFAVAVAVGLTPEMLPVVVTTVLARGSALLARRGVIVKRLSALPDVGAIDILCMDKTGTLTRDRPVLSGSVGPGGRPDPEPLRWAAVNGLWTLHLADPPAPDPLDEAILAGAPDLGEVEGLDAVPFDPLTRVSRALVRDGEDVVVVVKGAVEAVLERCALGERERRRANATAASLARAGARVLAVARGPASARTGLDAAGERDLTLVGFVTLADEPSPDAAAALALLARRGVKVKILTGDHPGTAARICRELGLEAGEVADAAGLTAAAAERATVIARCTPEQKARVVRALRAAGHTVGFLGDGVNDLPAMRAADVGICPRAAVDVTREAADIVLAGKDLSAIGQAVAVGRRSSGNIVTYLRIALSSNLGNVIAMLVAGLALPFLPMLPVQVLAQNLCFDAAQLALAFERPGPAALRRPFRLRRRAVLRFILGFGLVNAGVDLATFAVLTRVPGMEGEPAFHTGWLVENMLTQAAIMLLLRPVRRVSRPLGLATGALAVAGLLLPLSPLAPALGLVRLPVTSVLWLLLVLVLYAGVLVALTARTRRRA